MLRPAIPVWDLWEDEGRKNMRRRARAFVRKTLQTMSHHFVLLEEDKERHVWRLQVRDEEAVYTIRRKLLKASSRRLGVRSNEFHGLPLLDE